MKRFCLFILVCIMAVVVPACGDNADEATEKCKAIGPRCDNGVAINCRLGCSMLGSCSPLTDKTTCANGAQCGLRPKSDTEEWAYCIAQPETACDFDSTAMHQSCPTPTSVTTCDWQANIVVSYECNTPGFEGGIPLNCDIQTGSDVLVCKF